MPPASERDRRFAEAYFLALRLAGKFNRRVHSPWLRDRIETFAITAALAAARAFDPAEGVPLDWFVGYRVRAGIRDALYTRNAQQQSHDRQLPGCDVRDRAAVNPDDQAIGREEARIVRRLVDRLPQTLKDMIDRQYFKGESQADIACADGVHFTAACHRHRRAIARLRELAGVLAACVLLVILTLPARAALDTNPDAPRDLRLIFDPPAWLAGSVWFDRVVQPFSPWQGDRAAVVRDVAELFRDYNVNVTDATNTINGGEGVKYGWGIVVGGDGKWWNDYRGPGQWWNPNWVAPAGSNDVGVAVDGDGFFFNGFTFADRIGNDPELLAHNIAHELGHALGLAHPDGNYRTTTPASALLLMGDPSDPRAGWSESDAVYLTEKLGVVPEPGGLACIGFVLAAWGLRRRQSCRSRSTTDSYASSEAARNRSPVCSQPDNPNPDSSRCSSQQPPIQRRTRRKQASGVAATSNFIARPSRRGSRVGRAIA